VDTKNVTFAFCAAPGWARAKQRIWYERWIFWPAISENPIIIDLTVFEIRPSKRRSLRPTHTGEEERARSLCRGRLSTLHRLGKWALCSKQTMSPAS